MAGHVSRKSFSKTEDQVPAARTQLPQSRHTLEDPLEFVDHQTDLGDHRVLVPDGDQCADDIEMTGLDGPDPSGDILPLAGFFGELIQEVGDTPHGGKDDHRSFARFMGLCNDLQYAFETFFRSEGSTAKLDHFHG